MTVLRVILLIATLMLPALSRAADEISVKGACTPDEKWEFPENFPKAWKERFASLFEDDRTITTNVGLMMHSTKEALVAKRPETRSLAEYWIWRSVLDLGLVHAAHRGFNSIAARADGPRSQVYRYAALDCINVIHSRHPSLALSLDPKTFPAIAAAVAREPSAERKRKFWVAATDALRLEISHDLPDSEVIAQLPSIAGSGPYEAWIRTLLAARRGSDRDVLRESKPLIAALRDPAFLGALGSSQKDAMYLTMARASFGSGDSKRAIELYSQVSNTSNLFAQALVERAWAHLARKEYADAASDSRNLVVGGLKGVFSPDANQILSIALNETCHFPEALESMRFFGKKYRKTALWIRDWNPKFQKKDARPYAIVAQLLKGGSAVPEPVATELVRSPIFIARQKELNALYDARDLHAKLVAEIRRFARLGRTPAWKKSASTLEAMVKGGMDVLPEREKRLLAEIDEDLSARVKRMAVALSDASGNMQLIKAEVYDAFGERMIVDNALSANGALAEREAARIEKPSADEGSWDWGRFPASDGDDAEIWEDELGFLKEDVSDICYRSPAKGKGEKHHGKGK